MKEFEQIKKLADEASALAQSRKDLIKKEKESIKKAYEEFKSVKKLSTKLDEKELKSSAHGLIHTMNERYKGYEQLYETYIKALSMDQYLYQLLKKKDLNFDELKNYIEKLNGQYEKVLKAQNEFNNLTEEYNNKKRSFYKEAGITTSDPNT